MTKPTKILFVCHGNICRSPMAEFVMKHLLEQANLTECYQVASAATSREEIGNPIYPPAKAKLREHGVTYAQAKRARQITPADYAEYDWLIGMDEANIYNMLRFFGGDPQKKIHLLLDYTEAPGREVADPWYSGDFEATWRDVLAGCRGMLDSLQKGEAES